MQSLVALKTDLLAKIESADTPQALDAIRIDALGKKGVISEQLKSLGSLPAEERKSFGQEVNQVKQEVSEALGAKAEILAKSALDAKLAAEAVDISLPVPSASLGRFHPKAALVLSCAPKPHLCKSARWRQASHQFALSHQGAHTALTMMRRTHQCFTNVKVL